MQQRQQATLGGFIFINKKLDMNLKKQYNELKFKNERFETMIQNEREV